MKYNIFKNLLKAIYFKKLKISHISLKGRGFSALKVNDSLLKKKLNFFIKNNTFNKALKLHIFKSKKFYCESEKPFFIFLKSILKSSCFKNKLNAINFGSLNGLEEIYYLKKLLFFLLRKKKFFF